jgi:enamine deaminase RidA (YjgF/YER057c/UK114 family)
MTERQTIVPESQRQLYDRFHFAPAVVDDSGTVHCSGVLGSGADGSFADEPVDQFRQAFANVATVLEEAGCGWSDVVEMTTFHVDLMENLRAFVQAKDETVGEPYPAWTAIGVSALAMPGALVEVKVTARQPSA